MYSLERFINTVRFSRRETDGMAALKWNYLIFQFAVGMVSSFGIIFIYQLGSDVFQGLVYALSFICFQRVVVALSIPFVATYTSKVGYRRVMMVGLMMLAVKLLFFTQVNSDSIWPLFIAAIFGGFAISSYYLSYHALFIDDNDDEKLGEQIGFITMIGRMAAIISPFLAGVLINKYGFSAMFGMAIFLIVISTLPLASMKHHERHVGKYSFAAVWKFIKDYPKITSSMLNWHITAGIQDLYWAVYLFIILGSYVKFGIVGSVVAIANSIAIYVFGKVYDKRRASKTFVDSSVVVSITWVFRFLSKTFVAAAVSDIFNRIFSPPWWMKIRRRELVAGEEVDSLVFAVAHEYLVTFGLLIGWGLGYIILVITNMGWIWLAIPAVLGTLASTWILRKD